MKNGSIKYTACCEFLLKPKLLLVCQEEQAFGELLSQEKSTLLIAKEESRTRITELEEDIQTLNQRTVERETELERYGIFIISPF